MVHVLLAGAAAVVLLAACAHAPSAESTSTSTLGAREIASAGSRTAMCPMSVPGTHVSADDAVNGETLTFTTTGQVAELRSRVREMAEMHNRHHADSGARDGMLADGVTGAGHAVTGATMPPSWATVMDVEGGASLVLAPSAPADLEKLRSAARMRAQRMEQDGCGMRDPARGS
jgi:hypothetical protein